MKLSFKLNHCFFFALALLMVAGNRSSGSEVDPWVASSRKHLGLTGPTMQIDPTFPYYKNRSNESIVDEIELAGYKAVHYIVMNDKDVNGPLIEAFHAKGMPVWLMVVGNGTYSGAGLPAGWENWKLKMTKMPNNNFFHFFSLFNKDFLQWKKEVVVGLIKQYPFDGVEMAETYFPEWDAIRTGYYGDVGPTAQAAFKEKYNLEMPDFTNPDSEKYYRKDVERYKKWMQFRVDGVCDFQHEIFNGKGGVRGARPDILIATWSLVINAGANSVAKIREDQGLDAVEIVEKVKPDVHFFQTHWPDWLKDETVLRPNYMKAYENFTKPVRTKFPDVPLGLQADQGSGKDMIKSSAWIKQFNEDVPKYGYSTWTTYEYHLGGYIYSDIPKPMKAVKTGKQTVIVSFNKRIDDASGSNIENYKVLGGGRLQSNALKSIRIDGNRAILEFNAPVKGKLSLLINNISDTPALRLFKDTPENTMDHEQKIDVLQ